MTRSRWRRSKRLQPEHIVISPGPCTPNEAGVSVETIRISPARSPILGVCLGHQSIGQAFGGRIVHARQVMHGKTSPIRHRGVGVFRGLPDPVRGDPLSFAGDRQGVPAGLSGGDGLDRNRRRPGG